MDTRKKSERTEGEMAVTGEVERKIKRKQKKEECDKKRQLCCKLDSFHPVVCS